jgi:hypothetical protein
MGMVALQEAIRRKANRKAIKAYADRIELIGYEITRTSSNAAET